MFMTDIFHEYYKKIFFVLGIVIMVAVSWEIYYSLSFHLVSTTPSLNNIATVTPIINLNFNKLIANVRISSNQSIIKSWTVKGKTIQLDLVPGLVQGREYTFELHNVTDTKNQTLSLIQLKFTPKVINFNNLPEYEQQQIMQIQYNQAAQQPASFSGNVELTNNGISINQVLDYENAIQQFANKNKLKLYSVNILQSSVNPGPNNGTGVFSYTFTVDINQTPYRAVLQTEDITAASLQLYNSSGVLVFSSGVISN